MYWCICWLFIGFVISLLNDLCLKCLWSCWFSFAFVMLSLEAFARIELCDLMRYGLLGELTCSIFMVIAIYEEGVCAVSTTTAPPPPPPPPSPPPPLIDYPMVVVFGNQFVWFRLAPASPVPVLPATPSPFYPGRTPLKLRGG